MGHLFKYKKKGSIDVQFNWIFVLVIGALIIFFFISVMKSSEKNSTKSTYISLSSDVKNLIYQTESDVDNSKTIKSPGLTINFDCETFDIEKSSTSEDIKFKTIFSPNKLKGREILTYTLKFEMPYPADYFILMTSNEVRYNFINNCGNDNQCKAMFRVLERNLPQNTSFQEVDSSEKVEENNFYKERFIFINTDMENVELNDLGNADVTAINIVGTLDYGNVTYYKRSGDGFVTRGDDYTNFYLGKEMLAGAIISDQELYKCNRDKALFKLKTITYLYMNRTKEFKKFYDPLNICFASYNSINLDSTLNELESIEDINHEGINKIVSTANTIKKTNDESMLNSCPSIY